MHPTKIAFLLTTALTAPAFAQGVPVTLPVGENTEQGIGIREVPATGFAISIDGETTVGEKRIADAQRKADLALGAADVRVQFDGLGAAPVLDAGLEGVSFAPGATVLFQSRMNYPAFVERGEIRILDVSARGGQRTVAVVPIQPNGTASVKLPEGELAFVHRVYDAGGRYDETDARLIGPDAPGAGMETGTDATAIRNIRVRGGAVTVSGTGATPGAAVRVMGETVPTDDKGAFAFRRILPAGDHAVAVDVPRQGQMMTIVRDIEIPRSEWFYVAHADLTFGRRFEGGVEAAGGAYEDDIARGRLAFYAKGKTEDGYDVTASVDTGEEDLEDIFRRLDEKDPQSLLRRLDVDDLYTTYGDDSTIVEDAPTSGKFYVRVEKDGNRFLWGDFKSEIDGTYYLRNERQLYGAQVILQSQDVTASGEARLSFEGYAAQPDSLPQRDTFRGTGASTYFLTRQDVAIGSETVSVEIRDPDTGRVIERRQLVPGRDYDLNYVQGIISLSRPLSAYADQADLVRENPNGDDSVILAVQYEWTPAATDVDGYAYGGRAEIWATDQLRLGVSGQIEETGTADQKAYGADLRWQLSETTFAELEYARTEGPGYAATFSTDGGLISTTGPAVAGDGEAYRFRGNLDLADIDPALKGHIGAWYEKRTAGFSTLDFQTAVDEELYGVDGRFQAAENVALRFYAERFSDAAGKEKDEAGIEAEFQHSPNLTYAFGLEYLDRTTPGDATETGSRSDAALRVTHRPRSGLEYSVFAQGTLDRTGGLENNNRAGVGVKLALNEDWTFDGEVSDGSTGLGGRVLLSYAANGTDTLYFGYTLDPDRTVNGVTLNGRDQGRFVAGGSKRVSSTVSTFAENTYDLFGRHQSLSSSFGVDLTPSEGLSYTASLEIGDIADADNGDFERQAFSLGARYSDDVLTAKGRVEYRRERGVAAGSNRDADTYLASGTLRYTPDPSHRVIAALDLAKTDTDQSVLLDGEFAELSLGYAFRPVAHDRLNLLASYRYLYDLYGQSIDGVAGAGPRQKSHIVSLDTSYDITGNWSLGMKVGARLSDSAPSGTAAFAENDAWLAVLNARYHLVHQWDLLGEIRALSADQADTREYGALVAAYRHMGNNFKFGVGYNFGRFSDDLADLTYDDEGAFVNLVAKF